MLGAFCVILINLLVLYFILRGCPRFIEKELEFRCLKRRRRDIGSRPC